MQIQSFRNNFQDVAEKIINITETEKSSEFNYSTDEISNPESYSPYGLNSLGNTVGFPAPFIRTLNTENPILASKVIEDRVNSYFSKKETPLTARRFTINSQELIYGVVSDKYSYFDDDEVVDIISTSPIASFSYLDTKITPERLHLRAIDAASKFNIPGDPSPLFFSYFIDNSMVGASSFKITLGLYRQVCSNGMIIPMKNLVLCKQIHKGRKDIAAEFNESLILLASKKEEIKRILIDASTTQASLETLKEDFKIEYISKKLSIGKKEAEKVKELYDAYTIELGNKSKWAFANAVTDYAKKVKDVTKREFLESRALMAA